MKQAKLELWSMSSSRRRERVSNAVECEKQAYHVLKFGYWKVRNLLSIHSGENSIQMVHQEDQKYSISRDYLIFLL